jgi:hypothetical protein
MATTKTPPPDIRFIVDVQPSKHSSFDNKALDLIVMPVVVTPEGKIRNLTFGWSDDTGAGEYEGLRIDGRCDVTDDDFYFGTDLITFDIYRINARRADALVKTYRRLEKRFAAQNHKWGRPVDAADFLARIADAVGCPATAPFGRVVGGNGWSYDDHEYRWMDIDALRFHLQTKIKEWKES